MVALPMLRPTIGVDRLPVTPRATKRNPNKEAQKRQRNARKATRRR